MGGIAISDAMLERGARALCIAVGLNPDIKVGEIRGPAVDDWMLAWRDKFVWEMRIDEARACLEAALAAQPEAE